MFALGNLITAIAQVVNIILTILYWLILIRALISWVNPDPYNPIVQFLYKTTEPILNPIRKVFPPVRFDFSPIIAFLIIIFLQHFLVKTLFDLGWQLR